MEFKDMNSEEQSPVDTSTDELSQTQNTEVQDKEPSKSEMEAILDLSSVKKFKFDGKEMDYDTLKRATLLQSDYTRKAQELAKEREAFSGQKKYDDNLKYDLEMVRKDPSLASKFKETYPERYHWHLDYARPSNSATEQSNGLDKQTSQPTANLPPEILKKLEMVEKLHDRAEKQSIAAIDKQLDATFQQLSKDFPLGRVKEVMTDLETLQRQGVIPRDENGEIDDKMFFDVVKELYKNSHDDNEKGASGYFSQKMKAQIEGSKKASDVGIGGQTPGQAAKRISRIRDVNHDEVVSSLSTI